MNIVKFEVIPILVVGEQISGKTSLIKKCVDDSKPKHHPSSGILFDVINIIKEGEEIRLQIFDSGFHVFDDHITTLIPCYSIEYVIVCIDLMNPKSLELVHEWAERLKKLESVVDCKIVVCGTKADRRKACVEMNRDTVMSKSSKIINYFETSCESGQNICEVFDFIVDFYWKRRPAM